MAHTYLHNAATEFSKLGRVSQEKILGMKNIIFQGNVTSLRELLIPSKHVDYDDVIDAELLTKLGNDEKILVGREVGATSEDVSACYIKRRYNYNSEISEEEMCQLIEFSKNDNITIWNPPGCGTSTSLQSMAVTLKKNHPNVWAIKIDLNEYVDALTTFKQNKVMFVTAMDLLNTREETRFKSELEKKIFSIPNKVVLLVDGLDEINTEYKNILRSVVTDCKEKPNFIKTYIAYSDKVDDIFKAELWMYNRLKPFSTEEKVSFLVKHWAQKLGIPEDKCKKFAEQLIAGKWTDKKEEMTVGIPLQLKMVAAIFCRKEYIESETMDWKNYYEYITSNVENRFNLVKLFQLFIHTSLLGDKSCLTEGLPVEDKDIQSYFYNVALESILTKSQCEFFSCYSNRPKEISQELEAKAINSHIIKKVDGKTRFCHGTLVDYFLAKCIVTELTQNQEKQFINFFIDEVIVENAYKLVRLFLDEIISITSNCVPRNILEAIGQAVVRSTKPILHTLVKGGFLNILKFIFKCSEAAGKDLDLEDFIWDYETLLQEAISEAHLEIAEYLLQKGVSVNSRDDLDCTALHVAAKKESFPAVELLVRYGAEVTSRDSRGDTPLHGAATYGCLEVMKYLIAQGAVIDSRDQYGRTPLEYAAERGHLDKVSCLVEGGADVNTSRGSPLLKATEKGFFNVVKYLVEKGADVTFRNKSGGTVLHRYTKKRRFGLRRKRVMEKVSEPENKPDVFKYLIERGVNVNSVDEYGKNVLQSLLITDEILDVVKVLVENGTDINHVDKFGYTALDVAVDHGALEVATYLIQRGATLWHREYNLEKAVSFRHLDLVKLLLENGADLNVRNQYGCSPMHWAVWSCDFDMIKFLIDKTGDSQLNAKTKNGDTVLGKAMSLSFEIVEYLVERGARTANALELAAAKGDLPLYKLLEGCGETISIIQNVGESFDLLQYVMEKGIAVDMPPIFHTAANSGDLSIVRYLVLKGVDVNDTSGSYNGDTALHGAWQCGHIHIVKYLIRNGASIDIKNNSLETALYKAIGYNHFDIAKLLVEKGADISIFSTALREAIEGSRLEQVNFMVENGAKLCGDQVEKSLISVALINGYIDITEYLQEKQYGSIVETVNSIVEGNDKSSLKDILRRDVIGYLLERETKIGVKEINDCEILATAEWVNNWKLVTALVEKGADVNKADEEGYTALHRATDIRIIKYLVGKGADVNALTKEGYSVLHQAVKNANLDVCKFLVKSGSKIETPQDGVRPLAYIAAEGYNLPKLQYLVQQGAKLDTFPLRDLIIQSSSYDVIKYLIENGARVDSTDEKEHWVLFYAINMGLFDLFKLFLAKTCDIEVEEVNQSLFEHAVTCNDLDIVKYLAKSGAKLRSCDGLRTAVSNANVELVKFVLESPVDVSGVDQEGRTLLHLAAIAGSVDMLKVLLEKGTDSVVNVKDNNSRTPLHEAVNNKYDLVALCMVKSLVNCGADVNEKDNNGNTALYEAVVRNHLEVALYLIEQGAEVNGKFNNGRSILHEAVASTRNDLLLDVVRLLVEKGVDVNVRDEDGRSPIQVLASNNSYDYNDVHIKVMKLLIEKGAEVNSRSKDGRTALHEATAIRRLEKIVVLIEHGAEIEAKAEDGRSPLYAALRSNESNDWADYNSADVVQYLIKAGALLNNEAENETVLHDTAAAGDLSLLEFLIRSGLDIESKTKDGRTLLHQAACNGKMDVVKFLVKNGLDINARASDLSTALREAIVGGYKEIAEYLLASGADVNGRYENGRTLLHNAVEEFDVAMVKMLVKYGVDINEKDAEGRIALQMAIANNRYDLAAYLKENGAI